MSEILSHQWLCIFVFVLSQDDDADGEEEGEEEVKRAHKTSIGEMFSVREDQVSQLEIWIRLSV